MMPRIRLTAVACGVGLVLGWTALIAAADDPPAPALPAPDPGLRPLPITLPAALRLANANAVDILAAAERVRVAAAQLEQARVLWLPTITVGGDYARHDGPFQAADGSMINVSRSNLMFGAGTGIGSAATLVVTDAIFAPLVARQAVRARRADAQAAANDTLVAVSDAYFGVQQARGELAGAEDTTRRTAELVRRINLLATGLVPPVEAVRAEAELARRQQAELSARERWRTAGAELLRVVRLDAAAQVEPVEPPQLRVTLVDLTRSVDDLIVMGLTNRPELASRQAQVQATVAALRQERLRPVIPSVLIRGWSTPASGTLAVGAFGGGRNGTIGDWGIREDFDVQLLWQFDNLGLGNRGRVHQREAENRLAVIDLFRVQDRVASEVATYYAQAELAAKRVDIAERGVRLALDSVEKNLAGLSQTRRAGDLVVLIVRPQEAVAAVQALAQAYADYYGAVADANRAQFRLYRALGQPVQCLPWDAPTAAVVVPAAPAPAPPAALPPVPAATASPWTQPVASRPAPN
ncbi:MAG TPA: TolC family protein [Gemmataceae bacterium]|jgi:outer membrane protein TolC